MNARSRLPGAVIALGMTSFFTDIGTEMVFPLLPVFLVSLGGGTAFLGLIEGIADATAAMLKLGSGYVADKVERKKPLVLFGYGIAGLARPLVSFAGAPWHVLAVRVADRVGKGVRSAPRDVILASSVPRSQAGRAFGFHRAMDHAGAVVGPLVATLLLSMGWTVRDVFLATIVPGGLAIAAVLAVREPPPERAPTPAEATEPPSPAAPQDRARLSPTLRQLLVLFGLFALGNSSDAFLLLRAVELGVEVKWLPILWTAFHVSKFSASWVFGDLSDRVPRHRMILAGWGVYALTYLAFGFASTAWHAWALFLVYGLYFGLTEPVEKALVSDLAGASVRGRAFGYYNFIVGIAAVPAGLATGLLWQRFDARAALAVGAGIAALSALALGAWSARWSAKAPA